MNTDENQNGDLLGPSVSSTLVLTAANGGDFNHIIELAFMRVNPCGSVVSRGFVYPNDLRRGDARQGVALRPRSGGAYAARELLLNEGGKRFHLLLHLGHL